MGMVERKQFGRFKKSIKIYVCATADSFENMTGRTAKGATVRESVFLSPRLMEHPETVASYLTHELSHLMLVQHMGLYRFMTTPPWFTEGLAVFVSEGGGAGDVAEPEAIKMIVSGKVFEPNDSGGILDFFFRKYGDHWNLNQHLFYRQASLFVSFMNEYNADAFENMLIAMQQGQRFGVSFRQAYNTTTSELWQRFINQLKSKAEHETDRPIGLRSR